MLGIPKLTEKLAERDTGVECTTHRHVEGACGSLASGRVTYRGAPPSALAWQRMFRMRRGQTHVRHIKLSTSYRIHTNSLRFDDAPASALLGWFAHGIEPEQPDHPATPPTRVTTGHIAEPP
jgi:hypothetical protein